MLPEIQTIATRRRKLGLTQSELATLAQVSQSYIAKLEARKIEPSYIKVKAIIEALEKQEQKTEVKASDIMTSNVVSVKMGDQVQTAIELMSRYGYSQLPVLEDEKLIGSISERTIVEKIINSKGKGNLTSKPVSSIVEEAFPQIGEDAPISVVTSLLKIYPAVIVSRKGRVVGIVTKADLLKTLVPL
ncbi:CBS domain-containing protein [Candidatus Bathyarchaeota archaeon]|nr:CBS domain-containing protein [Candidatus Bathyarchaeota archaeon]MBS7630524.1 CBS domain-containing protein [Candidatus Bathyarchaeota archaeon]